MIAYLTQEEPNHSFFIQRIVQVYWVENLGESFPPSGFVCVAVSFISRHFVGGVSYGNNSRPYPQLVFYVWIGPLTGTMRHTRANVCPVFFTAYISSSV